jgi:aminoglycoside phosphotransferase (APT) family kinase protein
MAKPMPAAEVDVPAGLVRRLLAGQHPDLASLPVSFLANGWDNVIYRLGPRLLARFPRRALGATIIAHEQRWLPELAPRLPLPVPAPERTGHPALGYPYRWSVVPFIPGTPAAAALAELDAPGTRDGLDGLDWADVTVSLARFLAALHVPAPPDAPANPFRGGPLASRVGLFDGNLQLALDQNETAADGTATRDAVLDAWSDALAAPVHAGPAAWLHGDLHPANILVEHGRLSGVIDFGDITAGDPASDLSVAWMLLPLEWHEAFRAAYTAAGGGPGGDAALWRRARGWALALALVFLAHSADDPQLLAIGRRALAAALAG